MRQVFVLFLLTCTQIKCSSPLNSDKCLEPMSQVLPDIVFVRRATKDRFQNMVESLTDSDVQRKHYDCTHPTLPVKWISDIKPPDDNFRMTRSFNQRIKNETGNNLIYSSFFTYLYSVGKPSRSTLFICETVCGMRKYLEIESSEYSPISTVTLTPSSPIFVALAGGLNRTLESGTVALNNSMCEMTLQIQVKYNESGPGHHIFYSWIPRNRRYRIVTERYESAITTTDQGTYYRNVFRSAVQKRHCTKVLKDNETCENCKLLVSDEFSSFTNSYVILNSVAFYARSNDIELAYKGVFSITKPRRFYFDWEVPFQEMISMEKIPSVVFIGQEYEFNCSVSNIIFAHGTLIYDGNATNLNKTQVNLGETEEWQLEGHREVFKNFVFSGPKRNLKVTCSAPLWDWSQRVNKSVDILVDERILPTFIDVAVLHNELVNENDQNVTFHCSAYGNPTPNLTWLLPNENARNTLHNGSIVVEENGTVASYLVIPKAQQKIHIGSYQCFVWNLFGNATKTFNLQFRQATLSTTSKTAIASSLGVLIFVGIVILLFIYRRILLQRQEYRTKTEEAIREFREGLKKSVKQKDKEEYFASKIESVHNKGKVLDHDYVTHHVPILELPYDDRFEIMKDKWIIDEKLLGQGAFGFVRKGAVELENGKKQVVAIKMLKSSVEIDDFKGFLTELKIMAYIGYHPNIVSLVAACTQDIEQRDVMIGVEFCNNGSLQQYLNEKRSMFLPNVLAQEDVDNIRQSNVTTYANLHNPVALTESDLYTWSYQICNGMEFLASKQVLHGDLATRNVLLTADKTAKISDFGLSRVLLDSKNYTKKSRVPLPWKWMALESLKALQFSSASDVWAFGVTLWEIFTLGEVPFSGLSYGPEFISKVEQGLRLGKPLWATDYLYNLMEHCWDKKPERRAKFNELKATLTELLDIATNPLRATPVVLAQVRRAQPFGNFSSPMQDSPIAQPRRNQPNDTENWYSNRPMQVPNLYLNV